MASTDDKYEMSLRNKIDLLGATPEDNRQELIDALYECADYLRQKNAWLKDADWMQHQARSLRDQLRYRIENQEKQMLANLNAASHSLGDLMSSAMIPVGPMEVVLSRLVELTSEAKMDDASSKFSNWLKAIHTTDKYERQTLARDIRKHLQKGGFLPATEAICQFCGCGTTTGEPLCKVCSSLVSICSSCGEIEQPVHYSQ